MWPPHLGQVIFASAIKSILIEIVHTPRPCRKQAEILTGSEWGFSLVNFAKQFSERRTIEAKFLWRKFCSVAP
jgi:hypothetical protein